MDTEEENGREKNGRFKRGNLFSIGNTGGRPPVFKDAEEIKNKLAEYLDWEDFMKKQGQGKGTYTIEGAMLYLGFATRQSFHDNMQRDSEFSYVLSRFKLFLTDWNVKKLYWGGTMPGAKFWLTNHGGYTEESTQHQVQTVTQVNPTVVNSTVPLSSDEKDVK